MGCVTRRQFTGMLLAGAASTLPLRGQAQGSGKLTLYMGPPEKTCAAVAQGFDDAIGALVDPRQLERLEQQVDRAELVFSWRGPRIVP